MSKIFHISRLLKEAFPRIPPTFASEMFLKQPISRGPRQPRGTGLMLGASFIFCGHQERRTEPAAMHLDAENHLKRSRNQRVWLKNVISNKNMDKL